MKRKKFGMGFMGIAALAIFGAIVMLLWNLLMPAIFGLTVINFWQALGLFALARILFGSFGGGLGMQRWMRRSGEHNRLHEKWKNMSMEERLDYINKRREFGFGGPFGGGRNFSGRDGFGRDRNTESGKDNE